MSPSKFLQFSADLVTFTEEIRNKKHFSCSDILCSVYRKSMKKGVCGLKFACFENMKERKTKNLIERI